MAAELFRLRALPKSQEANDGANDKVLPLSFGAAFFRICLPRCCHINHVPTVIAVKMIMITQ